MWEMRLVRDVAAELTARNIPIPRGVDSWSPMTVMRTMSDWASRASDGSHKDVTADPPARKKLGRKHAYFSQSARQSRAPRAMPTY
jgi:hypothetical protein